MVVTAARSLYLKNGFVDIERYNDNYRVWMSLYAKAVVRRNGTVKSLARN
jgi:hypothetical protein